MKKVSICIITYNQEKYVAQAIESALMQQGDFGFEIIISDDCSTDNTPGIIKDYAAKYPDLIKPYFSNTNLGMLGNWVKALKLCKLPYIALLEGDDFWNDAHKLQKQVQILDTNSAYVASCTNANIQYEGDSKGYPIYVTLPEGVYQTKDLLKYNFMPTCSVLMRNYISDDFFPAAYFKSPFADWIIHILHSRHGGFHFLNEFTCTYRVHSGGVWGGVNNEKQLLNKLRALNCIAEIITGKGFDTELSAGKKKALQDICGYYRGKGQYDKYLKYRVQLLMS